VGGRKWRIIPRTFPIGFYGAFQFAPVKQIGDVDRDADALLGEQQFSDLLPRLAPLAQFADEFEVRRQDAAEGFAAAFPLCRFRHHATD